MRGSVLKESLLYRKFGHYSKPKLLLFWREVC
jgi:hypothetical protein